MSEDLRIPDEDARIEAILRSLSEEDLEFDLPPHAVWEGIAAAVEDAPAAAVAPVIDLASRRRTPLLLGAIAAALVVIAGLAVVLVSGDGTAPVEVAAAELLYAPDDPGFVELGVDRFAEVTLLQEGSTETVRVDAADLPVTSGESDLEIWLIGVTDGEIQTVQTLGLVEDPSAPGEFTVPAEFDRTAYDAVAVDISIEPHDGNEDHSGMSLVRGVLSA